MDTRAANLNKPFYAYFYLGRIKLDSGYIKKNFVVNLGYIQNKFRISLTCLQDKFRINSA